MARRNLIVINDKLNDLRNDLEDLEDKAVEVQFRISEIEDYVADVGILV
jgi:hypothetical protein